ncbi:MAG: hypothetical protein R3F29_12830 [Planctomycetota bacterium]
MHRLRLTAAASCLALTATLHAQLTVPGQFATIQQAVVAAAPGDVILVSSGEVVSAPINTLGKALTLRANGAVTITGFGASRVFEIVSGEGNTTVIEGFDIRNCRAPAGASPGAPGGDGGGVRLAGSSPIFRDCVFAFCRGGDGADGAPTSDVGGTGGNGGRGGAVAIQGGAPRFERCRFESNNGGPGGDGADGANALTGTSPFVPAPTGGVGGRGGDGGAVYVQGTAQPVFLQCLFTNNSPGIGGGGGDGGHGANSPQILGQYALSGGIGGAGGNGGDSGTAVILVDGNAQVELRNCTLADNWLRVAGAAGAGGAGGVGTTTGATGTSGSNGGIGLCTGLKSSPTSSVMNTVLWNHTSTVGSALQYASVDVEGGANCIKSAARTQLTGFGNLMLTTSPFVVGGYAPLRSGPLVDAAGDWLLNANITADLDGGARWFDHPIGISVLDIGALEDRTGELVQFNCDPNPIGTFSAGAGAPSLGTSFGVAVHAPGGHFPAPSIALLIASTTGELPNCGFALPGFGIDPTQPGTLLLDQPQILDLALWTGSPTPFSIAVPNNPLLLGPKLLLQGAMFDPQTAHIGLTRALRVVIGE